jgi:Zinc knuckle
MVVAAYNLVYINWKQENRAGWGAPMADGMAFANANDGKKTPVKCNVTCHKCGVKGHYATNCPELAAKWVAAAGGTQQTGATILTAAGIVDGEFDDNKTCFTFMNHRVMCRIGTNGHVPKYWVLLDNQCTIDVSSIQIC